MRARVKAYVDGMYIAALVSCKLLTNPVEGGNLCQRCHARRWSMGEVEMEAGGKRAQVVVRRVGSDCACSSDAANTSRADLFAAAVICIADGRIILLCATKLKWCEESSGFPWFASLN